MLSESIQQPLNPEIAEKISKTVAYQPEERYKEIFFEKATRLKEDFDAKFKEMPWAQIDADTIFDALQWDNEEEAIKRATSLIEEENWEDTSPAIIVAQHRQYMEERKMLGEELYRHALETTPEQWFAKAAEIVEMELPPDSLQYIKKQYDIAQDYLDDEHIQLAEEKLYKAMMHNLKETRSADIAKDILNTKKLPERLREDDDARLAVEVVVEQGINLFSGMSGQAKGNPFPLRYVIKRIDGWRELWPEPGAEEDSTQYEQKYPKIKLPECDTATLANTIRTKILPDEEFTKDKPYLEGLLLRCGLLTT